MSNYQAESFYRAKITTSITQGATCPITIRVSKLPTIANGLLTISPNTEFEEIVEYNNPNGTNMTIDIIKRWVKPSSILLTTNGTDYNNTSFQFPHTQNDIIRWDVNHIHINQGIGNTTLATNLAVGISKLSVPAVDVNNPVVVGDNDPRLWAMVASWRVTLTTSTTTTTTYTLWFRPKRVRIRAVATWLSPYSESETYDWGTQVTYTTYFRWDGGYLVASQNWQAVFIRNDATGTNQVIITDCIITATWFTLSTPAFTGYTSCTLLYEAIA